MSEKSTRISQLDSLRGIAALAVVFFHYTTRYTEIYPEHKINYFTTFPYGSYGVQLFFIISGFVIYMTISKIDKISEFFYRRIIRLYPAYIIAVIVTFTATNIFELTGRTVSLRDAIINLTMLEGFMANVKYVDGVYWTLTAELAFYVFIGLFFIISTKIFKKFNKIEYFACLWFIAMIGCKFIYKFVSEDMGNFADKFFSINFFHLFIAGILFYHYKNSKQKRYLVYILICLVYDFLINGTTSGIILSGFLVLFYISLFFNTVILNNNILKFLGTISYCLYLVHQNIGYIIIKQMESMGFRSEIMLVVPISLSIILATIITYCVEKPIQQYFKTKVRGVNITKVPLTNS